jgi:hypothetical protein
MHLAVIVRGACRDCVHDPALHRWPRRGRVRFLNRPGRRDWRKRTLLHRRLTPLQNPANHRCSPHRGDVRPSQLRLLSRRRRLCLRWTRPAHSPGRTGDRPGGRGGLGVAHRPRRGDPLYPRARVEHQIGKLHGLGAKNIVTHLEWSNSPLPGVAERTDRRVGNYPRRGSWDPGRPDRVRRSGGPTSTGSDAAKRASTPIVPTW